MVVGVVLLSDHCWQLSLASLATWAHIGSCSAAVNQHFQVLSSHSIPAWSCWGVVTQEQDPVLGLVEYYRAGPSPSVPFVRIPLNLMRHRLNSYYLIQHQGTLVIFISPSLSSICSRHLM